MVKSNLLAGIFIVTMGVRGLQQYVAKVRKKQLEQRLLSSVAFEPGQDWETGSNINIHHDEEVSKLFIYLFSMPRGHDSFQKERTNTHKH